MTLHLVRMVLITGLLVLCMVYPYLPGKYDVVALPLSSAVQLLAAVGLLFLPIGIPWLVYELRKRARGDRHPSARPKGFYFAAIALITASLLAILISLGLFLGFGVSFGVLTLAVSMYALVQCIPRVREMRKAESAAIDPTPIYLVLLPPALLLFQGMLAGPLTDFSRGRAIARSAEIVDALEKHRAAHGRYPTSLLAVHDDYSPAVSGIEKFHYAASGDAYHLVFEQPRFLWDDLGVREFVVYNPLDEHAMAGHAAWILKWSPDAWPARHGWFAAHDAEVPHWKRFLFD